MSPVATSECGIAARPRARRALMVACLLSVLFLPVRGRTAPATRQNLTDLSLEELMQIEVTTVSKRREKLTNAPAAVFALNGEDLQRSGANNLPDALRLVPGMQVAQVGAHDWAISARGFADVFSNKLLVLQDGRSVYTPLFSGVFWDAQDAVFEDIERIEVVRGPGATLWGANAVNGVINILSKPAAETQGSLGAVSVGTDPQYSARARYGGEVDAKTHYRVYSKYTQHDAVPARQGGDAADKWNFGQAGFRVDHVTGGDGVVTVQGDVSRGHAMEIFTLPTDVPPFVESLPSGARFDGANLLGRATRRFAGGSELMLQGYFDYTGRQTGIFGETRRTYDLEAQHRFSLPHQELTLGGGYRSIRDSMNNTPNVSLTPARSSLELESAFVQDDIAIGSAVHLVLGSKLEHNDYTGREVQPGARLLWSVSDAHTLWASVARAVRTPSRSEEDVRFRQVTDIPGLSSVLLGSRRLESELLTAYEAGWRWHPREKFSVDLAGFVNRYQRLRTGELTLPSLMALARLNAPGGFSQLPLTIVAAPANNMDAETYGGELSLAAQLAGGWRVRAGYSYLRLALHRAPQSTDFAAEVDELRAPRGQGYLWSQHDLSSRWKLDWVLRQVGSLAIGVPAYVALDVRVAWRPAEHWELSVSGRNLNDRKHPEFLPSGIVTPAAESPRSGQIAIKYEF